MSGQVRSIQGLVKVLSDQITVSSGFVKVRSGQVCMYQARSSQFRLVQVWSDQGQVKVRRKSCQDRSRSGQVQVRSDKVSSGQCKVMPMLGQVMVRQYNVRSMSFKLRQSQMSSGHIKFKI